MKKLLATSLVLTSFLAACGAPTANVVEEDETSSVDAMEAMVSSEASPSDTSSSESSVEAMEAMDKSGSAEMETK